jgi:DNA primase
MPGPADEIKARLNVVEIIGETVKLRRSGRTYTGLCPFHTHTKNTPSFVVWPEDGRWRCFGQCNEGGDIFKFVMKKENWGFREALEYLAGRAGVELKPRTPQDEARDEEYKRLRDLLALAVMYYRNLLINAPQAQAARDHLQKRGLKPETVEAFELGYALPAWDAATKFFAERGYSQKEMIDAGLLILRDDDSTRDRFRNRIMIPIRDGQGRLAGFGARALDPNDQPKFLNSPQTPLFNKGETVYALDRARKAISVGGVAVLVEGYMDVMAAHQAGFANVVSAMGTALTETQLRLMKKYARRIVLALDADAAGDKATLRGLSVAQETFDHDTTPAFDARGLIRNEGKLQADIRVFTLPDGLDPDDVISSKPDDWQRGVAEATPVVEYVMRVLTAGRDLDDPKVKSDVADEILPIIQDVADPVERDSYRQKLARLLKVDVGALAQKAAFSARPPVSPRRATPVSPPPPPGADEAWAFEAVDGQESRAPAFGGDRLEAYCLSVLVCHPALIAQTDRQLRLLGLPPLTVDDFLDTDVQIIFRALKAALDQDQIDPQEHMIANLDEMAETRVRLWLAASDDAAVADRRRVDDIMLAVLRLRKRNIGSELLELRFLQEEAQTDAAVSELYQSQIVTLVQSLQKVTHGLAKNSRRMDRVGDAGVK